MSAAVCAGAETLRTRERRRGVGRIVGGGLEGGMGERGSLYEFEWVVEILAISGLVLRGELCRVRGPRIELREDLRATQLSRVQVKCTRGKELL
jgi:hypothetical protein